MIKRTFFSWPHNVLRPISIAKDFVYYYLHGVNKLVANISNVCCKQNTEFCSNTEIMFRFQEILSSAN